MHEMFVISHQQLMYYIIWLCLTLSSFLHLSEQCLMVMYEEKIRFANDCMPSDSLINSNAIEDQNL